MPKLAPVSRRKFIQRLHELGVSSQLSRSPISAVSFSAFQRFSF
jgi:hypothetical protein